MSSIVRVKDDKLCYIKEYQKICKSQFEEDLYVSELSESLNECFIIEVRTCFQFWSPKAEDSLKVCEYEFPFSIFEENFILS